MRRPDRVEFAGGKRFPKSWLLADLGLAEQFLRQLRLVPVMDTSVKAMLLDRVAGDAIQHADVLDRMPIKSHRSLVPIVQERADIVWISCGTPLGLPLMVKPVRSLIPEGRIIGVASASAFNDGYAGLALRRWRNGRLAEAIIRFYGGEAIHVRPMAATLPTREAVDEW